jgi:hypothetical protein
MTLPIRTTVDDISVICKYLASKPTGATLQDLRAVLDKKYQDGRKLNALKFWGLVEDENQKLRVTPKGRALVRDLEKSGSTSNPKFQ